MNAEARDIFSTFSKSNEGAIGMEDVGAYIRSVGFNPSELELQQIQSQLNHASDDDNISFEDIMDAMKCFESHDDSYEDLLRAFHYFDPGNTGYIASSDFKRALMSKGEALNDEEVAEMLKHANVDKKGRIKYVYFAQRLSKNVL